MATQNNSPWMIVPADEARVKRLCADTGLSAITGRILVGRGIDTADGVRAFLEPSLERDWLAPSVIPGMDEAAERVARAVNSGERVLVFGDFDLDGISAAAVATRGLRALGADVEAIVPHRFTEGYGLSEAAIERIRSHRPDLVVTVDCGISAAAEVSSLLGFGIDVVITDHHEPGDLTPSEIPVADPKLDSACPCRDLAGAGVALKLVQAVGGLLGDGDGWRDLTDLASLGTIADIVALSGENRALVAHGVARTRHRPRVAIAALCAVAGASCDGYGSETIAFSLAPRLNAAGRMADPEVSLELLLSDDPGAADALARTLDEHNRHRQAAESELTCAAEALAARIYRGERALVLAGEGWHEGVKGIVASKLAQRHGVPAFLFSIEDGIAKGSARSVGTVDLFAAVSACAGVLERFGGHTAAVGLTLRAEDLEEFRGRLLAHLDGLPDEQFHTELSVDAEISLHDVGTELGAELALLEPFGHGNPRPLLAVRSVFMNDRSRVGRDASHLKFVAYDGAATVPAIAFRCEDIDRRAAQDMPVDLAFEVEVDEWRGRRRAQLVVRDVRDAVVRPEGASAELLDDLFAHADETLAREDYAGIEEAPSFHTKLAGVTFEGRQEVLARLEPGTALRLVRQPDNEFDANACAVFDAHGDQLGFLNRRLAAQLAPVLDAGVAYDVEVTEVTGGEPGRSLGVNVLVTRRDAVASAEDLSVRRDQRRADLAAMTPEELDAELVRCFIGDRQLHAAQVEALASLQSGSNTLAVMATGRGKSLIFHLHAARTALREGSASVFVYPLRALVADQAFHLGESFAQVGLSVATVTGETPQGERDEAFGAVAGGKLDVVLTTPEFFHVHQGRFAATGRIGFVVVDEAHHIGLSRAGHRPAYGRLGECLEALGHPAVLAVTATASDDVAAQIRRTLSIESVVLDPTVRDNLRIEDGRQASDKDGTVSAIAAEGGKLVVYVNSRDASVRIARMLRRRLPELAWKTAFYHGGLSRSVRHAVERAFRGGEVQVVIATSAFGEGVNIPDIRNVVLYHLPFNDVEFNQMAGRAGRDGALARIHLLFGDKDARINERILAAGAPGREDLAILYRVLRDIGRREGPGFEITNAEIAERASAVERGFSLDERGVSSAVGIFRELGFVTGEGHGSLRRLTVVDDAPRAELETSVRYAEALEEIEEFARFKAWAMESSPDELLARFNRPILPGNG